MNVYAVRRPIKLGAGYPQISGAVHPNRESAETEQRQHGGEIEELEFDDYGDDAREYYALWPAYFPKAPFPVAVDNLMARYADDDPRARAAVLESAARVLRGQR